MSAAQVPPVPDVEGPARAAPAGSGAPPGPHGLRGHHARKAWLDAHRGFLLFASLVLLLVLVPFFERSERGHWLFAAMNLVVLTVSVIALGRSRAAFWVAVGLAGPAFLLLVGAYLAGSYDLLAWSWRFAVGAFVATLAHLVRYVLRPEGPEGVTVDRLYGGAAAYLLLGLVWCYLYALREHYSPGSFSGLDPALHQRVADMVFLSFASLTTGGGADIVPQGKAARTLVMLEQIAGTLYLGAFVARLVGMYGAPRR